MGHPVIVLGASGYGGLELLRLLDGHSGMRVVGAAASTRVGDPVGGLLPHASSYEGMGFVSVEEAMAADAELVFSSLPHGQSASIFGEGAGAKVVDVSGDFRLKGPSLYEQWHGEPHPNPESLEEWVYGLTELRREEIRNASRVADPGCYAAAAVLALAPLVEAGFIDPNWIHVDAKSGISGAGRAGGEGFGFAEAAENARPYSVTGHKHIPEIEQELSALAGSEVEITFVPHLVPMSRGLLVTCAARLTREVSSAELIEALRERFRGEPFVRVLGEDALPETKRLSGTNTAEVTARADPRTGVVLAMAALDNLGKGAAGQAVQNANLMLGFEETTGLATQGLVP
ncbi:MAG: N-acetyl-gamma-glutamyl-phosphate reductase [Actinomycetota bacterium]